MSVRITNYGMDAFSTKGLGGTPFEYCAVGTGTGTLSQARTTMFAELTAIGRKSPNNVAEEYTYDPVNNFIQAKISYTFEFTFSAAYNLTEVGLFDTYTGNTLSYHDLFRSDPSNPNSSPIVISVVSGDILRIYVDVIVRANWTSETTVNFVISGTSGNNGAGRHDGRQRIWVNTSVQPASAAVRSAFGALWPGVPFNIYDLRARLLSATPQPTGRDQEPNFTGSFLDIDPFQSDFLPYTSGTYRVDYKLVWPTGNDIVAVALAIYNINNTDGGYCFRFTNPANLSKGNTQRLEIIYRRSWVRL